MQLNGIGGWCFGACRDPEHHWDLYQLGEELIDLEDAFRRGRFRHVTTVERVIGFKRGTGGTGGVSYLRKMLEVVLFPEIWKLRTSLWGVVLKNKTDETSTWDISRNIV